MVTIYAASNAGELALVFIRQLEPWPINRLGHVLERRIKRQSTYFNILLIVISVVSLISGILHALPIEDDEEIFYTLAFFQEYFPRCQRFLCFVYRMGFVLLSIVMPAPFLISIYVGCHAQYQICMLVHVLKTVNKVNQTEESDLLLDKNYQEKTKNLLKFCIKRHCQLTQYVTRIRSCYLSKKVLLFQC